MIIWAFDPGVHCGWVVYDTVLGVLGYGEPVLRGPSACVDMLNEMAKYDGFWPDLILYEDFRLRPGGAGVGRWGSAAGLSPVYVMGWIQGMACVEGYSGLWVSQMPGERMVVSASSLGRRGIGWYDRVRLGHYVQAMRHLAVLLRKRGLDAIHSGDSSVKYISL